MKATGIVRQIDHLGRIVIPIEMRRTMQLNEGDAMEIFVDGDRIILQKYAPGCIFCGSGAKGIIAHGKPVCQRCVEEIVKTDQLAKRVTHG